VIASLEAAMRGVIYSLWRYRFFIWISIKNDFQARFVRSKLGGFWVILQPLSQVLIYAFILSNLLSSRLPGVNGTYAYAVYLMAGLLCWNLFTEIIDRCLKIFISNANTLKKVNFPRMTLPVIAIGSALINNCVLFLVMNVIFLLLGHWVTGYLLYYFLLAPIVAVFAAGIGLSLGVINVFVRDTEQVVPIVLQVLFWFTPIVYPSTVVPAAYLAVLGLSPLYVLVGAYHDIVLYHQRPPLLSILIVAILAGFLCAVALALFRKANSDMVDAL
jgi:lipopolysaccharide transport system permease protein